MVGDLNSYLERRANWKEERAVIGREAAFTQISDAGAVWSFLWSGQYSCCVCFQT